MSHYRTAETFLVAYSSGRADLHRQDREREEQGLPQIHARERDELERLLREAQVYAILAVAEELEAHRMAGWGRRA